MGLLAAWLVHLYTASSAVFGLWAIVAAIQLEFRLSIYLMLLTLVIDSTDGALARAVDVRRRIPWMDGRRLDDICDYFTYVLVPAVFLVQTDLLPHPSWAALPVLTVPVLLGGALIHGLRFRINLLSMGEDEARTLGVSG